MNNLLIYSFHRSASNFLHLLAHDICSRLSVPHYSINDEAYYGLISTSNWATFIEGRNGCFGPIRIGESEPSLPYDFLLDHLVVQVRDPRDILTSLYYALCYRFPLKQGEFPTKEFQEHWIQRGIDAFVLNEAVYFVKRFNNLIHKVLRHDNAYFVKYEDMVTQFPVWLDDFFKIFLLSNATIPDGFSQVIYEKYFKEFSVEKEDCKSHKRQVVPGDHIRKLKPVTVEKLNAIFDEILIYFDYDSQ